jgi:hypothetical protein
MEGARREEAFCCLEVARAQQKAQLVGWGAKLARRRNSVGKSKYCLRWTLLKTGGDSKASRSTVLRMFIRGMMGLLLKLHILEGVRKVLTHVKFVEDVLTPASGQLG